MTSSRPGAEPTSPPDRCPYARPFPPGFDSCAVFHPEKFEPSDSADRPLSPAITCANLALGRSGGSGGGFYARCQIGSARDRWLLAEKRGEVA